MLVAAGGATGATARYLLDGLAEQVMGSAFPFGTFIVNLLGSFVLGVLIEAMALVWDTSMEVRLFLVVGLLGAFTTFSTFALDTVLLYQGGAFLLSATYVVLSVVLAIGGFFAGMRLTRRVIAPRV